MKNPMDMLREFHDKFDEPHNNFSNSENRAMRRRILLEEFVEYITAELTDDLVEIADALADIVYVAYGTAHCYNIPLDQVLEEVHRSNMTKLGADGKPIYRDDGKILKGPNYESPQIKKILDRR